MNKTKEIKENKSYKRTIFWVGSGISSDEPTCFPLGDKLTELALQDGLGNDVNSFIEDYRKVANTLELKLKDYPRLETIFQIYKIIDENFGTNYLSNHSLLLLLHKLRNQRL